jgi:hypothetical protein
MARAFFLTTPLSDNRGTPFHENRSNRPTTTRDLTALRLTGMINPNVPFTLMQEMVFGHEAKQFDIIHSHLDCLGFPTRVVVHRIFPLLSLLEMSMARVC